MSKERISSSPIRSLRSEVQLQSPRPIAIDNSFLYFLNAAGVTLMNGQDPHEISKQKLLEFKFISKFEFYKFLTFFFYEEIELKKDSFKLF